MRTYFFHLGFELYKGAPNGVRDDPPAAHIPPPATNIFAADEQPGTFPLHSTYPWSESFSQQDERIERKRAKSDSAKGLPGQTLQPGRPKKERSKSSTTSATGTSHSGGSKAAIQKTSQSTKREIAERDWRFERVSVVSIDMPKPSEARPIASRAKSGTNIEKQKGKADALVSQQATKARYIPLDPKNTELGWGVVHLYRDEEETPGLYDDDDGLAMASKSKELQFDPEADCTTLCILAVPSYMSPSDLLGYVGEKTTTEDVSHFRLIRTGRANKYMVLMKFRDGKRARQWQKEYNGKSFNSMEVSVAYASSET
jgi:BRCA1-associated protein